MAYRSSIQRYELKYLITAAQRRALQPVIDAHTVPDEYGKSRIANLYYDTPDRRLIRRSLEKPAYKEKLRLRSYGTPKEDSTVYLELKKKACDVVGKRRTAMRLREVPDFLNAPATDSQIRRELAYFLSRFENPAPAAVLCYDREAYFDRSDPDVRVTFDTDIRYRDTDLSLESGTYGTALLDPDTVLLEVKVGRAMPLWLAKELSRLGIRQTSFSKYGRAYIQMNRQNDTPKKDEVSSYALPV